MNPGLNHCENEQKWYGKEMIGGFYPIANGRIPEICGDSQGEFAGNQPPYSIHEPEQVMLEKRDQSNGDNQGTAGQRADAPNQCADVRQPEKLMKCLTLPAKVNTENKMADHQNAEETVNKTNGPVLLDGALGNKASVR